MYTSAIWEINIFEKILFLFYTFGASYCFLASTLFHWFGSMNERAYVNLIRMDMSGIALLTGSSYVIPLFYGFYCSQTIATFYVGIVMTLTIVLVIAFLTPEFSTEAYRSFRLIIFSSFALFGIIPIAHMYYVYGLSDPWLNAKMLRVFYMYLIYACGALFYLTRVPERFFKFKFDTWLHSHQFWHLFVFLATLYHYHTCVNARHEVMIRECYKGVLKTH
jgi:adiponectin receptor